MRFISLILLVPVVLFGQSAFTNHYIIVVSSTLVSNINTRMIEVNSNNADRFTFTVPLSPSGLYPPTHYVCEWRMNNQQYAAVTNKMSTALLSSGAVMFRVPTNSLETVMATMGLQRITTNAP